MPFVADLHIHSYLSRATSRTLDLEHIHAWAQRKGIAVVATGDFTHPRWLAELRDKLVPAGAGLFRLRDDLAAAVDETVPAACRAPVQRLSCAGTGRALAVTRWLAPVPAPCASGPPRTPRRTARGR